jgi:hypothetical protein
MSIPDPVTDPVPRHDLVVLGCGLLVFVASFLPWYSVTFAGGNAEAGLTGTYNAWHGLEGIGVLLLLFSVVVAAAEPFVGDGVPALPVRIVATVVAVAGAALVVTRSFDLPSVGIPGASSDLRWGGWVLIVLAIVQAGVSALRMVHAPRSPAAWDQPGAASGAG